MEDTTTSAVYGKLFPDQVSDRCSSDALEANNGPIAYLHALYQMALGVEANGDPQSRITLAGRRPDIGERVLDQGSLLSAAYAQQSQSRMAELSKSTQANRFAARAGFSIAMGC
ncbi:hypothetical protein JN403_06160 [Pseudomonas sp. 15A4]|nr:hypothetical protein JN403_06160 [Pseudomonas sp. 15A4]